MQPIAEVGLKQELDLELLPEYELERVCLKNHCNVLIACRLRRPQ